jgi:S-methylmethionine-dependent homocysteine/selenocysteine methylase
MSDVLSATPQPKVTILDGGMGRLLERLGAPFRLPEWSALALIEAPDYVSRAHQAFIESGAQIITTNSFALLPHTLGEARFYRDGQKLAWRAGHLAKQVAQWLADGHQQPRALVAGSLPPLFESYQPQRFIASQVADILTPLINGLAEHIDLWLIETQSSTQEALSTLRVVQKSSQLPVYVAYTLKDEQGRIGPAELRSGEPVAEAVAQTLAAGAAGILFNCSQPEVMSEAIIAARKVIDNSPHPETPLGVYANAFEPEAVSDEPYAGISALRCDLDPEHYLQWVQRWVAEGATLVGGCCGIGPEHIAKISAAFKTA